MVIKAMIFSSPCNGHHIGSLRLREDPGNSSALHQTLPLGCSWTTLSTRELLVSLGLTTFSLPHPGRRDEQSHSAWGEVWRCRVSIVPPKDKTLLRKKSSSKDSTELYTISNHNKKVLGGASCWSERGNVGRRDLNQRLC